MPLYIRKRFAKDKGHGEGFQYLYRNLRRELVNPMIEAKREKVAA